MDDSTPDDRSEVWGDADGAATSFEDENDDTSKSYENLNLQELDLAELVRNVLVETEAALSTWGPVKGVPRREAHPLDDSVPGGDAVPVRLQNGTCAWLDITNAGAIIFTEPLRSDRTILAALCVSATLPVDPKGIGDSKRLWEAARVYVLLDNKGLMEPFNLGRIIDQQIASVKSPDLFNAWKLRLHAALIRRYRSDYDALPEKERIALLVEAAKRVNATLSAVRGLQNFLEEGDTTGLSKQRPRTDHYKRAAPQRDIRAAELRDALGLKHHEIAMVLGFPLPNDYRVTYKVPAVSSAIRRGQKLLKQALPSKGEYENYMQRMGPALENWRQHELWRMSVTDKYLSE